MLKIKIKKLVFFKEKNPLKVSSLEFWVFQQKQQANFQILRAKLREVGKRKRYTHSFVKLYDGILFFFYLCF